MTTELQRSRDKNATGALMLWRLAEARGDDLNVTLARAILQECGYPGGEGAPSVAEAQAAIVDRDTTSIVAQEHNRRAGQARFAR